MKHISLKQTKQCENAFCFKSVSSIYCIYSLEGMHVFWMKVRFCCQFIVHCIRWNRFDNLIQHHVPWNIAEGLFQAPLGRYPIYHKAKDFLDFCTQYKRQRKMQYTGIPGIGAQYCSCRICGHILPWPYFNPRSLWRVSGGLVFLCSIFISWRINCSFVYFALYQSKFAWTLRSKLTLYIQGHRMSSCYLTIYYCTSIPLRTIYQHISSTKLIKQVMQIWIAEQYQTAINYTESIPWPAKWMIGGITAPIFCGCAQRSEGGESHSTGLECVFLVDLFK